MFPDKVQVWNEFEHCTINLGNEHMYGNILGAKQVSTCDSGICS